MGILRTNKTMKRLEQMLDEAMEGTFQEVNYDETELSRLESRWKQYLSTSKLSVEAARKERADIKSILSDISHQTKTPLANIILYSELLKEQPLTEEGEVIAEQLHVQAEKLEFLIKALVKMSRLESDILEVVPVKQPLRPLVENAIRDAKAHAQEKSITILEPGFDSIEAVFDLKWTEEALFNILDNGIKYSPNDSTLTVSVIEYPMYVCIRTADEGPGIPEEERSRIFSRFYRGAGNQQEEGVGIGLYLAREIVRKNDGYIKVGPGTEKGSVFEIYLGKGV
ncbi:HAMP domain-containing histidine kinase [Muricomes sp. OA1]|uniref:histidine kinase n=1 Tax=Hungatella hathewayi TaxID=154046 RepID=A0A3E2X185_9FIRM|nr:MULTISPECIES: HAMP domain-containing sensor histidine kinase [Clostridia]MCH1971132.1 HAMP domain-containing histidine kinase [Muricomes sp. OA1]RGC35054.1 sensor histidine kinase [Hungatella hathewayi]GKH34425.1 two-component sensor histidine kinase [Faecalicatena contorta]